MSKTARYIAFYGVFLLVFLGMHLYVYLRLKKMFAVGQPGLYLLAAFVLAFSFPVCSLLEKFFPGGPTMVLYALASIWLGALFLLLSALVAVEPLRLFVDVNTRLFGWGIIGLVGVVTVWGLINGLFIKVKETTIPLAHLEKPLRAVLLSDIHVGTIHNSGYLNRVVEKTNALKPEVVFITGDFFDGIGPVTEHTVQPLGNLQARTFFIMGNHEKYSGMGRAEKLIAPTGVRVLRNEVAEYLGIQIIGIDYPEEENRKDNQVIHGLAFDRGRPSVLLYHAPVGLADARRAGVHVQLSGHTHNGQLYPFNLLVKLFYPRARGLFEIDGLQLYVTPGTGTWGPPMRLGSSNEITLIKFVPAAAGGA